MKITARFRGDKKLEKKLKNKSNIKNPLKTFLDLARAIVTRKVKEFSPVDTGVLRATWTSNLNATSKPMTATVSAGVAYALPLEESGYKPRGVGRIPFFKPAIDYFLNNKDKYFKELGDHIEKRYRK